MFEKIKETAAILRGESNAPPRGVECCTDATGRPIPCTHRRAPAEGWGTGHSGPCAKDCACDVALAVKNAPAEGGEVYCNSPLPHGPHDRCYGEGSKRVRPPAEGGEAGLPDEDDFTHYFNATARLSKENAALRSDLAAAKARGEEAVRVAHSNALGIDAAARVAFVQGKKLAAAEREIERLKENGIRNASDRSLVLNRVAGERDEARRELEAARGALAGVKPFLNMWCEDCGHTIFQDGSVEKPDGDEGMCDNCENYLTAANAVRAALAPPKDRP